VSDVSLLFGIGASTALGVAAGFVTGLVPGLHINNLAAGVTANFLLTFSLFSSVCVLLGCPEVTVAVACFLLSSMVAHMFSEAIPSTYLGLPSADVVSVLPAHRLARAGLGDAAVMASAEGSLAGLVLGIAFLPVVCLVLGPPVGLYTHLRQVMGFIILSLCALLLLAEGLPHIRARKVKAAATRPVALALALFVVSGLLGILVFRTDYFACRIPDAPWLDRGFVTRSSLLLPMFAGLFGIPTLVLSLGEKGRRSLACARFVCSPAAPRKKDLLLTLVGGTLVGWIPGMTSGSSATLLSPMFGDSGEDQDVSSCTRFIWLYSAISASGSLLAVGAFFVISRARSGVMEAVSAFLAGDSLSVASSGYSTVAALLLSMMLSAVSSYILLVRLRVHAATMARILDRREVTLASLVFIVSLSFVLTGTRGVLLMATAAALGLIPPLAGVRRINLMGCLLVPVVVFFLFP